MKTSHIAYTQHNYTLATWRFFLSESTHEGSTGVIPHPPYPRNQYSTASRKGVTLHCATVLERTEGWSQVRSTPNPVLQLAESGQFPTRRPVVLVLSPTAFSRPSWVVLNAPCVRARGRASISHAHSCVARIASQLLFRCCRRFQVELCEKCQQLAFYSHDGSPLFKAPLCFQQGWRSWRTRSTCSGLAVFPDEMHSVNLGLLHIFLCTANGMCALVRRSWRHIASVVYVVSSQFFLGSFSCSWRDWMQLGLSVRIGWCMICHSRLCGLYTSLRHLVSLGGQ